MLKGDPTCQKRKHLPLQASRKYGSISFGGIPNSRNVLFLQIFLKRAAKPSAGNTSAGFSWIKWPQILFNLISAPKPLRPSPEPSQEPSPALHQSLPHLLRNLRRNLLRNPVEADLALNQSLPDLLRNLLRNPVEPELTLHQSLPDLLRNLLRNPVELDLARNLLRFSGTFSEILLNLTWLCTKASPNLLRNLLWNPVERDLAPPKPPRPSPEPSEPFPEPCWTWPGACTSAHRSFCGLKTSLAYAVGRKCSKHA